jgi:GNAT superfamily N-acetyltransferase
MGVKMVTEVSIIKERFERAGIGLKDALSIIGVTLDAEEIKGASLSPYDLFKGLSELIDRTVHGTRIESFKPGGRESSFHTFEIHTETGDVLGYLNMLYLRKPIPCYYLVYVEVLSPFRGRGLGNKILKAFKDFVIRKGAVGILDNIIPPEDVTYGIYTKLGWKGIDEILGKGMISKEGNYMVFIPESIKVNEIKDKIAKLLFNLRKKRPVIDMQDNEAMVKRTIQEFRRVYELMEGLFEKELSSGVSNPLMRFMFTKFVTKLLGFRRRISELIGYTGGESLEQIYLSERARELPIQPYSIWGPAEGKVEVWRSREMKFDLPEELYRNPTQFIEALPIYRRPYIINWLKGRESIKEKEIKISDLLELGFDPTKLRELFYKDKTYIIERLSPHLLSSIEKKERCLRHIADLSKGMRFRGSEIHINPPLSVFKDRGNIYVIRSKIEGIHLEEAIDQLKTVEFLKEMNKSLRIDQAILKTIKEIRQWLRSNLQLNFGMEIDELTFFVSWEIERNMPKLGVDINGVTINSVWLS